MGLFDGIKKAAEDKKAELEAKAKEMQDKLNPLNALKSALGKNSNEEEEQQPVDDEEQQPSSAASASDDCEGNANNVFNDEYVVKVLNYLMIDGIGHHGLDEGLTKEDIIAAIRRGSPYESKSTEGDFRKALTSSLSTKINSITHCWYDYNTDGFNAKKTPNVSVEDVVAYINEHFEESLENYYKLYPSKRPGYVAPSAAPAKPERTEPNADNLFDSPNVLNIVNIMKQTIEEKQIDCSKDDVIAALRRKTPDEGKGPGDFKKALMNTDLNNGISLLKTSLAGAIRRGDDILLIDVVAYIEENW